MRPPFQYDGHALAIEVSIGIAPTGAGSACADDVMVNADLALRAAKIAGRNRVTVFSPDMREGNASRLALVGQFSRALAEREFELFYQPQIRLLDGAVVGMEALLRWRHPERGRLSPAAFLDALEGSAYDVPAGRFVIGEACRQAAEWRGMGSGIRVSVNVSSNQLHRDDVPALLRAAIAENDLPPELIEVEITERIALDNAAKIRAVLDELRGIGVGIAFDDFGTGYASLASLTQFPLDRVKIDKGFVQGIDAQEEKRQLTGGLIHLCHRLGYAVVAEGVETQAQAQFLAFHECGEAQGYLYSRPLPSEEVVPFLHYAHTERPAKRPMEPPRRVARCATTSDGRPRNLSVSSSLLG